MGSRLVIERIATEEVLLRTAAAEDIAYVEAFSSLRRRCEVLAWRAIVRRELGAGVAISYDEYGAPQLDIPNIYISVSHSRDYVAVLFAEWRCAVDVESVDRNFRGVAERYLSAEEREIASAYDLYAEMWCAKEALYKYFTKGNIDLVEDIVISECSVAERTFVASVCGAEPIEVAFRRDDDLVVATIG